MPIVRRAIIMAAGTGSRMNPVTLETPKPLVEVNGRRMIETVIDSLLRNGIQEIHVVVGYLKEQFAVLKEKYSEVDLIVNPYYDRCNNISSLYVARDHLRDCIVLDGDQIVYNDTILTKEFERSGYNAIWTDSETSEWLLDVQDGIVRSCSRTGGKGGWQLFSISRWSEADGLKLKKQLEIEFAQKKNTKIYWDDIALFCYPTEYELGIRAMNEGDIIEIDTVKELATIDEKYACYLQDEHVKE